MRILHTSDWHLGLQSGRVSRAPDHQLFFEWLLTTLCDEEIDALIVAGDVFDGVQPSSEVLSHYYRFLRSLEDTGVRDVVVVGGNHDSAAQLDAPQDILGALDVHVRGGYAANDDPSHYLVPLRRRGHDAPAAVCIALPYVHEYRLGIRTTGKDAEDTRKTFEERFAALYQELTHLAEQRFPGVPLVATGHLTVGSVKKGDAPREIHRVGSINALSPSLFDPRLCYVALGHIHRSFPVERGRIWYSGTPIATALPEADVARRVLRIDLDQPDSEGNGVKVSPISVPCFRELLEFTGSEDAATTWLKELDSPSPLGPLLHLRIKVQTPQPGLAGRLRELLARLDISPCPELVDLREVAEQTANSNEFALAENLDDLSPLDVFSRLCRASDAVLTSELKNAFEFVSQADEATLQERIEQIENDRGEA